MNAVVEGAGDEHSTLSPPISLKYSSWNSKAELAFWLVLKSPKIIAYGVFLIRNARNIQLGAQIICSISRMWLSRCRNWHFRVFFFLDKRVFHQTFCFSKLCDLSPLHYMFSHMAVILLPFSSCYGKTWGKNINKICPSMQVNDLCVKPIGTYRTILLHDLLVKNIKNISQVIWRTAV